MALLTPLHPLQPPPPYFISPPQFNVNVQWCPLVGRLPPGQKPGEERAKRRKKTKPSLLLFSPSPPLVCCPAGCDLWPPDPHSWPLDPFPRHAFLCPPRHGNTLVTAAATVTDGLGPGNNFIQPRPEGWAPWTICPKHPLLPPSLPPDSHTYTLLDSCTAPPTQLWHLLCHILTPQSPWIHSLSRGLWVSGPDRVINTEIPDSPWHVHRTYTGIRISYHYWHKTAPKKTPQSHPHIPFHTAGIYGWQRRSTNFIGVL